MADISAAMVKELREATQLPMMKCKQALVESGGDMQAAMDALRKQGATFMDSRGDRSTEEGRIAQFIDRDKKVAAMIELQVESAPVAGNAEVVALANDLAKQLATGSGAKDAEALWDQPSPSQKGKTLREVRDEIVNKIREVFRVPRIKRVEGLSGGYVHHDGKSAVLLEVEGGDETLARDVSMHIAAMKPQALTVADLDAEAVEREKGIQKDRARAEGKPENIIDKMIEGRMRNFYAENVLLEQPFVKDDKLTVGAVAKGGGMTIKSFTLWKLGEGSES
ncbi:Elongation factor Ts [Pirellulimonas nuda]|uniref:Elongation factor Ts n=1 Tax=Pirellulimonas nuda TaxID=2528009 RepID=A0A518D5L1_9BACT|nr:translation elongation factor Ts [Pirellulimonas nuda]QDU86754.1 Elongation factor Ts [Pirellulimonas nuda]